ncbi:hypothetical protein BDA99DRAFT_580467 [Phascolomyces articulosus]|uniref:Tc1-like transposase DDE domain-containing protein n=1 Tax=Phascolomyces articulosus TaxID=60185 RepID=A0AAD5KBH6_9FUNG|nr:hypothetical protein BDA99DRAFT_580467 [Phascolomyces articulosus]
MPELEHVQSILSFINKIMDTLDDNNMKGRLVVGNAPIHVMQSIACLVEQHRYKYTYLAPYFPFLNSVNRTVLSKVKLSKYGVWPALLLLILVLLT